MNELENILNISQTSDSIFDKVDLINRANLDVEDDTESFAIGEFNSDGISDLVVVNSRSDNLSVLLGNGDGTFRDTMNFFDVGEFPRSVAVGEFNGDGISDLAVADGNLSVLLGNGDASFSNSTSIDRGDVEDRADFVAIGEFNGDGILDLAVQNTDTRTVISGSCCDDPLELCCDALIDENRITISVLLGNGDGSFNNTSNFLFRDFQPFANISSTVVGEFNGDGISDLALADGSLSVLLGNGDGSFSNATTFDAGEYPRSVAVGEFNGDSISDLAVANFRSDNVSVLLGNGDGSFSNAINFDVGEFPRSVAVGEFNGDNISDLAVANSDDISVLLGNGNGSFSNAINFDAGEFPSSLAAEEFNSDSISDLAVLNGSRGDDNISILFNTTPVPSIGGIIIQGEAVGTENNDLISGSEIDDKFFALAGDDIISVQAGDDEVNGNRGNDVISGGAGNDNLHGGRNLDYILGDDDNDLIFGDRDSDTLNGGEGADTIYGGKQNDEIVGEEGNDFISGDLGDDTLSGDRGNDTILGQDGNDLITGGEDPDLITGGEGSDTLIFSSSSGERDEITDFSPTQGDLMILDKRTFSAIESESGSSFSIASEFAIVTNDELAETANAVIVYNLENGNLFYNPNGSEPGFDSGNSNPGGIFATLSNTPLLTAGDFFIR
ncbi:MAG: hypothetical protein F6K54_22685 [Okeania sp. SIO3B5]|uniref:FG-GAP-like repeat-containing protein n=1 Tax=Okeania sp. SIO3B5 TaxID=2607811 RepID=UPI0014002DD7|nr:FG-GAP-like repeat-containing protein [Okeania sp. SIO3B5]NEO55627.1 hypothetical protein [Okeania sp. SIO3B5]